MSGAQTFESGGTARPTIKELVDQIGKGDVTSLTVLMDLMTELAATGDPLRVAQCRGLYEVVGNAVIYADNTLELNSNHPASNPRQRHQRISRLANHWRALCDAILNLFWQDCYSQADVSAALMGAAAGFTGYEESQKGIRALNAAEREARLEARRAERLAAGLPADDPEDDMEGDEAGDDYGPLEPGDYPPAFTNQLAGSAGLAAGPAMTTDQPLVGGSDFDTDGEDKKEVEHGDGPVGGEG